MDITNPSLDKLPIYARLGVPEVWRYDGERLTIFGLRGEGYAEVVGSSVLPPLTREALSDHIKESASLDIADWVRRVREWLGTAPADRALAAPGVVAYALKLGEQLELGGLVVLGPDVL